MTEIEFDFPSNDPYEMELRRQRISWKLAKPDENDFSAYTRWLMCEPNMLKVKIGVYMWGKPHWYADPKGTEI